MNAHVKTLLTLTVLVVLLLVGVAWGWSAMTKPFPKKASPKACYPTTLPAGARVSAPKVTVSVFNASERVGLAERTMAAFQDQGFGPGKVGNAPQGTIVHFAQVWSKHPANPAVRLVASRLGPQARVVARHHGGPGVVVMVGPLFNKLVPGKASVKVTHPTTICSPPTG